MLRDRLETLGAPHTWEGTTLVVASADEAWVERIMDQVDEELSAPPEDEVDDEQVAYDLTDWDDDSCVSLLDALATEAIPYALDGDELFVASERRGAGRRDRGAPSPPPAPPSPLGGPASFEAMSELFVAADELSHDPDDRRATASLVDGARAAAGSERALRHWTRAGGTAWSPAPARWPTSSSRTEPDDEQVIGLATDLRDELRPFI